MAKGQDKGAGRVAQLTCGQCKRHEKACAYCSLFGQKKKQWEPACSEFREKT